MKSKQQGISLLGLIIGLFLLVVVALFAMKVIPSYLEYSSAKSAIEAISRDQQINTPLMVRNAFEALGELRERLLPDQSRADAGEPPLGEARKAGVEFLGHRAAEHPVAEELEALVVVGAGAAVRERLLEKRGAGESVSEPFLEFRAPAHCPFVSAV